MDGDGSDNDDFFNPEEEVEIRTRRTRLTNACGMGSHIHVEILLCPAHMGLNPAP